MFKASIAQSLFDVGIFIYDIILVSIFLIEDSYLNGEETMPPHFRPFSWDIFIPSCSKYAAFRRRSGISSHRGAKVTLQTMNLREVAATGSSVG